jgi:hypothetical protein
MAVYHLVLIRAKADADPHAVKEACSGIMKLKDKCMRPATGQPYMPSSFGGKDTSPEGLQDGVTHVFIMEFECEEDRKYYLEHEPAHKEFVGSLGGLVERIQIVDFIPGLF